MGIVINTLLNTLGNLEKRGLLESMLTPASTHLIRGFEHYANEVRILESEVGPQRVRVLIEAHDNLVGLTSQNRDEQIQAAKRLAQTMNLPKINYSANKQLRSDAKSVKLGVKEYLREAIFFDGLILAAYFAQFGR